MREATYLAQRLGATVAALGTNHVLGSHESIAEVPQSDTKGKTSLGREGVDTALTTTMGHKIGTADSLMTSSNDGENEIPISFHQRTDAGRDERMANE